MLWQAYTCAVEDSAKETLSWDHHQVGRHKGGASVPRPKKPSTQLYEHFKSTYHGPDPMRGVRDVKRGWGRAVLYEKTRTSSFNQEAENSPFPFFIRVRMEWLQLPWSSNASPVKLLSRMLFTVPPAEGGERGGKVGRLLNLLNLLNVPFILGCCRSAGKMPSLDVNFLQITIETVRHLDEHRSSGGTAWWGRGAVKY